MFEWSQTYPEYLLEWWAFTIRSEKKEEVKKKAHGCDQDRQTSQGPMSAALSNHQNSRTEWHTRKHGALEILRKELCGFFHRAAQKVGVDSNEHWRTSCQKRGFVHDVPASGVATIGRQERDICALPRPRKRERFGDGKRDATTDYELLNQKQQ